MYGPSRERLFHFNELKFDLYNCEYLNTCPWIRISLNTPSIGLSVRITENSKLNRLMCVRCRVYLSYRSIWFNFCRSGIPKCPSIKSKKWIISQLVCTCFALSTFFSTRLSTFTLFYILFDLPFSHHFLRSSNIDLGKNKSIHNFAILFLESALACSYLMLNRMVDRRAFVVLPQRNWQICIDKRKHKHPTWRTESPH